MLYNPDKFTRLWLETKRRKVVWVKIICVTSREKKPILCQGLKKLCENVSIK